MFIVQNQKEESFSIQKVYVAFFELSPWHQEIHFLIIVKKRTFWADWKDTWAEWNGNLSGKTWTFEQNEN